MSNKKDRRRAAAPQAKGYSEAGASLTRRALKGFVPDSGAPNEDINRNNATLRQRARMLYMAAPVATAAINTNRTKVIGTGLTLKASVDREVLGISPEAAKKWQHAAEMEFRLWAGKKQNCDALGLNNFESLQQLALKSWLLSGDVFALVKRYPATPLNPYTLRLHIVEADRACTPSEYGGGVTIGGFVEGKIPEGKPGAGHKVYDGVEVPFLPTIYPNTLVCYSYSKSLSLPGERIGYVAVNPACEDAETMINMCGQISRGIGHNCPPSIIQLAVAQVLDKTADLSVYETNMNILYKELLDLGFTCVKPGGTFYIFPKALEEDAKVFSQKALKYDLVLVPGDSFGAPGYFRMAYCVDTEKVERSLEAFRKFVKTEYGKESL